MPRKAKLLTEKELKKIREVTAYDHHDKKRANNPTIGMSRYDRVAEESTHYAHDPHIDPSLDWAGKAEGMSFDVPATSIHIHESIKPSKILRSVESIGNEYESMEMDLFGEDPLEKRRRHRDALEFYKHGVDWTNRLIAGDSLVIMNSLLEKEGMAGQVQMCYIDPPYGIKYGSNFQPFVNNKDVKDKKDSDLTQEPEMVTAFRDTWELGIHSYLTYLRNRILLARELLNDTGSIFVQISDENIHHIRELCDEIFGCKNFVSQIYVRKTGGFSAKYIDNVGDYIVWYAKDKEKMKYHILYKNKFESKSGISNYPYVLLKDGTKRPLTKEEKSNLSLIPNGSKLYGVHSLTSSGSAKDPQPYEYNNKVFTPKANEHWKATYTTGLDNLAIAGRLCDTGKRLGYIRFFDDFPLISLDNNWDDTRGEMDIVYVVQTSEKPIQRCLLMTTDPDDLVLDITCGSGTTAYVAEQWGRRWITCDTSRVAIELAKERLMTATFDYYKLAHPEQGISSGFVYKTVPHITLKSIANKEPPAEETLYDQPEIDKSKVRISGPFTVEALPAPINKVPFGVKPIDEGLQPSESREMTVKQNNWRDEMLATGILGKNGAKISFSRIEPLSGTTYFQAEGETKEDEPKRVIICFGSETKVMDVRYIDAALDEAESIRPRPGYIIFAAFQFGPEATQLIDDIKWPDVTALKVQMNTDLMTEDLKKKRSSNQSFWLVGQPDVNLVKYGNKKDCYRVQVDGFDYYDVKTGKVISGSDQNIAMWMLDTNYDPNKCIEPSQVFFPMGGRKGGWNKLAKTLKAEINQDLIENYAGNVSLPFIAPSYAQVAVKIIDDRGIESLRVIKIAEALKAGEQ